MPKNWVSGFYFGKYHFKLGELLEQIHYLTKEDNIVREAIETYKQASIDYEKGEMPSHVAESYWHVAQLYDKTGENQEASQNYEKAAKAYLIASKKIPQLEQFYTDHCSYMQAWSEIELAQYFHLRENYQQARINYEKAAGLQQNLDDWKYLASNYFAWARIEDAEESSRTEKPQKAIENFQQAVEYFKKTENNIKTKINEKPRIEEKNLITEILKKSNIRQEYCQARILMEEAKLLEREGKNLDSSKNYGKAAQKLSTIVEKMDTEVERKELEYIEVLSRAWEKMTIAEEATSSDSYLEAAELFEQAKDYCFTKKASLWALGNSSFCRGLAAGIEYQSSADLKQHSKAKSLLKSAANSYLQAGFKQASEYAKATQRLFDAYAFMNQAENELNQQKRAKNYQMAENLLQIAAGSFMKSKQPEKTAQVQQILANVREEKELAVSLNQVMQAPTIASSTLSFSAPSPTNESSVGLEKFEHANVQANLVTTVKEAKVGESFCLSIEFVNAGKEPALLMRVEDFIPSDFIVVKKPEIYRLEETILNMKGKPIAPLKLVEVKLTVQPSKKGDYRLKPRVHYLDEVGQPKDLQLKTLEIKIEEVIMEDRVTTGTQELDSLLLGGIPKEYAVVLTGSPSDERQKIIKNFLEIGIKSDESVYYITSETTNLDTLFGNPNFVLFLCNPKPKTNIPNHPNIYKLRSKTDLTNLSISLTKAYRNIKPSKRKRICIETVSDVLIAHKVEATRRWISELITDLGDKGFTILGVIDPTIHPADQANAIINLFDGEINITQSSDPLDCKKSIIIKKLRNQDYIKNPICFR
ncbi:MAG: ATPase domain-containing protein [Candidatus Bathyarchaeota archaeon]